MIIIPEIETVVIQPPRTGTSGLRNALLAKYPRAFSLYRHMERPGIPMGYEKWRVVCSFREPLERLYSLYCYMRAPTISGKVRNAWCDRPFADWLTGSSEVFTSPGSLADQNYDPYYNAIHSDLAIARRSQFLWARPDLGNVTLLALGGEYDHQCRELFDCTVPEKVNTSSGFNVRSLSSFDAARVEHHLDHFFAWDRAYWATGAFDPRSPVTVGPLRVVPATVEKIG